MDSMKRQKIYMLKDKPPKLESVQYATKEKQKCLGQKLKQCSAVDVSGSESKV